MSERNLHKFLDGKIEVVEFDHDGMPGNIVFVGEVIIINSHGGEEIHTFNPLWANPPQGIMSAICTYVGVQMATLTARLRLDEIDNWDKNLRILVTRWIDELVHEDIREVVRPLILEYYQFLTCMA